MVSPAGSVDPHHPLLFLEAVMSLLMSSANIVAVAAAAAVGANNAIKVVAALVTLFSRDPGQVQRALKLLTLYSPRRQSLDRMRRTGRVRGARR